MKRSPEKSREYYEAHVKSGKRKLYWTRANAKIREYGKVDRLWWRARMLQSQLRLDKVSESLDVLIDFVESFDSCAYCLKILSYEEMSVDHIVPGVRGLDNIQIICRDCNFRKGALTDQEYRALLSHLDGSSLAKEIFFKRVSAKGIHEKWESPP